MIKVGWSHIIYRWTNISHDWVVIPKTSWCSCILVHFVTWVYLVYGINMFSKILMTHHFWVHQFSSTPKPLYTCGDKCRGFCPTTSSPQASKMDRNTADDILQWLACDHHIMLSYIILWILFVFVSWFQICSWYFFQN